LTVLKIKDISKIDNHDFGLYDIDFIPKYDERKQMDAIYIIYETKLVRIVQVKRVVR